MRGSIVGRWFWLHGIYIFIHRFLHLLFKSLKNLLLKYLVHNQMSQIDCVNFAYFILRRWKASFPLQIFTGLEPVRRTIILNVKEQADRSVD